MSTVIEVKSATKNKQTIFTLRQMCRQHLLFHAFLKL